MSPDRIYYVPPEQKETVDTALAKIPGVFLRKEINAPHGEETNMSSISQSISNLHKKLPPGYEDRPYPEQIEAYQGLVLNYLENELEVFGIKRIHLTYTETRLLGVLMKFAETAIGYEKLSLCLHLQSRDFQEEAGNLRASKEDIRNMQVQIYSIRKKLKESNIHFVGIDTINHYGYVLRPQNRNI